ncbi:MAG: uroporphyrinogen decarboxylase [Acidobacteriota bacterium]|jgi:uroporphyrinogen decarboxylase
MNDLFLREARGEPTERRPVWMMRQAGRYMPEYRAIRAEHDFLTMCRTPELVAEVTLQPVRHIGVDAAILFADILLPLDAMGSKLVFARGEGPTFPEPVRTREDIARLEHPDVDRTLGYVFDAVRATRREIEALDEQVPLIGFAGTPWTLAAYLTEGRGSQTFPHLMAWSWRDPDGLQELLGLITDVSIDYLRGQVEAGAQAVQLFDTWGGLLDQARWRAFAMPSVVRIAEALRSAHPDVPLIYYGKDTAHLLPALAELPVDVLSVDWRQPLSAVRRAVGDRVLQGNLDPMALLSTPDVIERQVARLLDEGSGGGHIVNLGHGIHKTTPPENARAFVEAVKRAGG